MCVLGTETNAIWRLSKATVSATLAGYTQERYVHGRDRLAELVVAPSVTILLLKITVTLCYKGNLEKGK
jgi:hypothetical protein